MLCFAKTKGTSTSVAQWRCSGSINKTCRTKSHFLHTVSFYHFLKNTLSHLIPFRNYPWLIDHILISIIFNQECDLLFCCNKQSVNTYRSHERLYCGRGKTAAWHFGLGCLCRQRIHLAEKRDTVKRQE